MFSIEQIAKVAFDLNAAICRGLGDDSQPSWEGAADWQKESVIDGVEYHMRWPDALACSSHNNWLRKKYKDGWTYSEVKDPEKKTHPCLVEFDKLPIEQQLKDHVFRQAVHSLMELNNG